jgi:nucleoid-associated protein YgaU
MSNKSKAVVAVCIVAGILGLIIFDLALSPGKNKTANVTPAATPEDNGTPIIKIGGDAQIDPPIAAKPAEEPQTASKGNSEVKESPAAPAAPAAEEYEVKAGDNIWTIAKKKYGDGSEWHRIAEANPNVNMNSLPVGKKIVIPAKPAATPAVEAKKGSKEIAGAENSEVYTVQAGDTLSTISSHFFQTVKYAKAIFEANKELIRSPDRLKPGIQIVIPKVKDVSTAAAPKAETPPAPADPAPEKAAATGKRTYKVQPGDSLWKIAAKYDAKHVHDMIEKIVHANSDKLESLDTPVKVGWDLVIPE